MIRLEAVVGIIFASGIIQATQVVLLSSAMVQHINEVTPLPPQRNVEVSKCISTCDISADQTPPPKRRIQDSRLPQH